MDPNLKDQIFNLIDKSQSILLLTHAKADCDGLGSMISMYLTLQSMGKEVVAATNDPAPDNLSFLPSMNIVQNSLASRNFVITLDISNTPLNKIKYKLTDDQKAVNIIVSPAAGHFKAGDVSFNHEEGEFDLIMTFDTGNLEHLGGIYERNAELFFRVPVINIDHHASNTDYGTVNMVNMVAASTTEVMLGLLEEMEKKYQKSFVTPDIATLLLAGLITDTGSFQHANTSPHAMETAAKLLDKGARQQEIIKNIYKTKKISTLKLWGTVLSKVQSDPIYRLVWSSISKQDLEDSGASADESETIIDDLLSNAPGTEIIMLFKYNDEGYVSVSMRSTTNSVDVGKICQQMGGGGHIRAAGFKRRNSSNLDELVSDTLHKVREYQAERLNIHLADVHEVVSAGEKVLYARPETPEHSGGKTLQYLEFKDERKPVQQMTPPAMPTEKVEAPSPEQPVTTQPPQVSNQMEPAPQAPTAEKKEEGQHQDWSKYETKPAPQPQAEKKSQEAGKQQQNKPNQQNQPKKPQQNQPKSEPVNQPQAPKVQEPSQQAEEKKREEVAVEAPQPEVVMPAEPVNEPIQVTPPMEAVQPEEVVSETVVPPQEPAPMPVQAPTPPTATPEVPSWLTAEVATPMPQVAPEPTLPSTTENQA